jgi:two-component system phosphate regulon sensor histidine kinase PhoR
VADPGAFTTVVDHLLDNAVKYSPEGGPVVLGAEASNGYVRVKVADRGVGMTSEQAARCFDKFWQADSTDERGFKGSGIGLYIVRSVVEAMGGRIEVDTAPGRGTTFTFSLRRADPETTEPAVLEDRRAGEDSIVREFMRQIGIPEGSR